jgi:integrase
VVHGIVAAVFKAAIRDRKLMGSPCEGVRLPKEQPRDVVPLETATVEALIDALPSRYQALVVLSAGSGLRQGECLGLSVDRSGLQPPSARPALRVDRQLVLVQGAPPFLGPPKTSASNRLVPLPRVVVGALSAHLAAFPAVEQEISCRDTGGKSWQESVALVFTDEAGNPIRRTAFSPVWRRAVRSAKAPRGTTFHDLRHYYASLLIRHGESVKLVQKRLGHATAGETLDTYSHLWPDSEDRTREAIDSVLGNPADFLRTGETS